MICAEESADCVHRALVRHHCTKVGIVRVFYGAVTLKLATYEGRLYGVPGTPDVSVLLWNKDLFKRAGPDPEKGPTTMQEVYEDAKRSVLSVRTSMAITSPGIAVVATSSR